MAEIRPPEFRGPRPTAGGTGAERAAQTLGGVVDVLGAIKGFTDAKAVTGFREDVNETIEGVLETPIEETGGASFGLSTDPAVNDLVSRVSTLRAMREQGTSNRQGLAELMSKQLLSEAISKKPHLRNELIQAYNQETGISTDLDQLGLQDAFLESQGKLAQDEIQRLTRLSDEFGVDARLVVGSREWASQFSEMAADAHKRKAAEARIENLKNDATVSAAQKADIAIDGLYGPDSPLQNNVRAIQGQMNSYMDALASGRVDFENDADLLLLKERLVGSLDQTIAEVSAYPDAVMSAQELTTPFGQTLINQTQVKVTSLRTMRQAIIDNDMSGMKLADMEFEIAAKKLGRQSGMWKARVAMEAFGKADAWSFIASGGFGPEGLAEMNKLTTGLITDVRSFNFGTAPRVNADTAYRGTVTPEDEFGPPSKASSYFISKAYEDYNKKVGDEAAIAHTLEQWDNNHSSINVYTAPKNVATQLGGIAGLTGLWEQEGVFVQEAEDKILGTFSAPEFSQKVDVVINDGNHPATVRAAGHNTLEYLNGTALPIEERVGQYDSIWNSDVQFHGNPKDETGKVQQTQLLAEKVSNALVIDMASLEENKVVFRVKSGIDSNLKRAAEERASELSDLMTRHAITLWNAEKLKRNNTNVSFKAIVEGNGMSQYFIHD